MQMQRKCASLSGMSWVVGNMMAMDFESASFYCVIEKGTLDELLVGRKDMWNPEKHLREQVAQSLSEISRVLTASGEWQQ